MPRKTSTNASCKPKRLNPAIQHRFAVHFDEWLEEVRTNKPERTRIDENDLGCCKHAVVGYGARLGFALLQNNVVSEILLNVNDLLSSSVLESLENKKDGDDNNQVKAIVTRDLIPLLDYLRSSPTLHKVILQQNSGQVYRRGLKVNGTVQKLILTALCENRNNQGPLDVTLDKLRHSLLTPFLHEMAHSLVRLNLKASSSFKKHPMSCTDQEALSAAVQASSSLKHISLIVASPRDTAAAALLKGLVGHGTLETVKMSFMGGCGGSGMALTDVKWRQAFLDLLMRQSCTNIPLLHAILVKLPIEHDKSWEFLSTVLQSPNCVPIITLADCPFDEGASGGLQELVHSTKRTKNQSQSRHAVDLIMRNPESYSFPGSYPCHASSLFDVPCTSRIRIRELCVKLHEHAQLQALSYYLPLSRYMRYLHLVIDIDRVLVSTDGIQFYDDRRRVMNRVKHARGVPAEYLRVKGPPLAQKLLDGLRGNGSLQDFSVQGNSPFHYHPNIRPFFSEEQDRKRKAYIERNRKLPQLLSNRRNGGSATATATDVVATACSNVGTTPSVSPLPLYPDLLAAANATPNMTPTHVLMGLLSQSTIQDGEPVVPKSAILVARKRPTPPLTTGTLGASGGRSRPTKRQRKLTDFWS